MATLLVNSNVNAYTIIAGLLVTATIYKIIKDSRTSLPPGPRGIPVLGNIFNTSPYRPLWVQFKEFGQYYGSDIICLKFFGTTVIIANSLKATSELFVKRGTIYSNKPVLPLIKLVSFEWPFPMSQYNDETWKAGRKLFRQEMEGNRSLLRPEEELASRKLLKRLLEAPEQFHKLLRHMAGELILSTTYGMDVLPENDPNINRAEQVIKDISDAFNPGLFLVSMLPILKRLPSIKRKTEEWKKLSYDLRDLPFEWLKKTADGTYRPSVGSRSLAELRDRGETPDDMARLADILGTMFAAGSDTTVSSLLSFFLVMAMNPEILRKGQAAIDSVTGGKRLPTFADRDDLPYVEAIAKEVLRWNPVGPIGSPHATSQDDVYNGWMIPKGSIVIGNTWAILRDENLYGPETDKFIPERFLNVDGSLNLTIPDTDVAFGK
uniref:Putative cytochrome P450 n=1 Tax=Moniliophthora roreri TaxID=221103 RepID=A0A0W0FIV6_MONRR